jgi:hypothetical protein
MEMSCFSTNTGKQTRVKPTVAVISKPATVNSKGPDLCTHNQIHTTMKHSYVNGTEYRVCAQELDEVQADQEALIERANEEQSVRERVVHSQQGMCCLVVGSRLVAGAAYQQRTERSTQE